MFGGTKTILGIVVTHFKDVNLPVIAIKSWAVADYLEKAINMLGVEWEGTYVA